MNTGSQQRLFSRLRATLIGITIAATVSGCSVFGVGHRWGEYDMPDKRANLAGAVQLFPDDEFETIDLALLLDPQNKRNTLPACVAQTKREANDVDAAFIAFEGCYDSENSTEAVAKGITVAKLLERKRNGIQERVLQVSDQYCNVFKSYLQRARSTTNFTLGSLSTLAGVAGGIVTGVDGSRILSGVSGALSGVKAEFNQEYFLNVAMPVITKGIDLKRKNIYTDMVLYGQHSDYEHYDVAAAVKDAIKYHGACSITAAFETAEQSIEITANPGLDAARETIKHVNELQRELNQGTADLKGFRKARKIGKLEAGKPFPEEDTPAAPAKPDVALSGLVTRIETAKARAKTAKESITKAPAYEGLGDAKTTVATALDAGASAILTELTACQAPWEQTSKAYYAAELSLSQKISDDDKRRAQTEVDIALDKVKAVKARADSVTNLYDMTLSAFVASAAGEHFDAAAATTAADEFDKKIKTIKACSAPPAS